MFIIINMRKFRLVAILGVTLIMVAWMLMFPQHILRFFYPLQYQSTVFKYAEQYHIDPYLVMAVIKVESNFKAEAQSHKGAKGLMQLTDGTAQWGAEQLGMKEFDLDNLYNPETNIHIGCWYLNNLMNEFDHDIFLVLAAYNGGSGNVTKWLKDKNYSQSGKSLDRIPFKETEQYVKKVMKEYAIYKKLYDPPQ